MELMAADGQSMAVAVRRGSLRRIKEVASSERTVGRPGQGIVERPVAACPPYRPHPGEAAGQ